MKRQIQYSQRRARFQSPTSHLLHGDALSVLKTLEPDSVDLVCTDPPYGIGFMGKAWDVFGRAEGNRAFQDFIASAGKELLRVMKPGAFVFMLMAPRQDSLARAIAGLEDAGFRIAFTSLYWTFASGFPKALNIGKAVDKRDGRQRKMLGRNPNSRCNATTENSLYKPGTVGKTAFVTVGDHPLEGAYGGFQPKPAVEVIVVAMKPLSEKTYIDQALKNGKGVTWLDDCRVPCASTEDEASATPGGITTSKRRDTGATPDVGRAAERVQFDRPDISRGRFPANLLVSDDVLNDGIQRRGSKTTKVGEIYGVDHGTSYMQEKAHGENINDSGSYSRYFDLDAWSRTIPFLVVPKASKCERGKSCIHPTVKPLKLMSYLITLGSRPGDIVLDPFLGSGTSGVAAKSLGRHFIGIEREAEYLAIARARIRAANRKGAEMIERR